MKRCPECDSSFPDTYKFCDLDGAQLVADYSDSDPNLLVPAADVDPEPDSPPDSDSDPDLLVPPAELSPEPDVEPEVLEAGGDQDSGPTPPGQNWKTLAIVAVAGVAIGVILFVAYQGMTRQSPVQSTNESANEVVTQQPITPPLPLLSSPTASASPSAEPSPSPSARPTPAAPAASPGVALSSSPVSTSGSDRTRRGPVTIRLTDGTSVEAEEVWETKEGIWYRRRGLVTLLKRDQVRAIDKPPTPSPTPKTVSSPSKSP
ncbi:MAG: hypothetical protein ND895_12660 [Pyrinomonadaceae bacterium]|nr:hypothetical protein [Pyrinomonadaceae bacterium]